MLICHPNLSIVQAGELLTDWCDREAEAWWHPVAQLLFDLIACTHNQVFYLGSMQLLTVWHSWEEDTKVTVRQYSTVNII